MRVTRVRRTGLRRRGGARPRRGRHPREDLRRARGTRPCASISRSDVGGARSVAVLDGVDGGSPAGDHPVEDAGEEGFGVEGSLVADGRPSTSLLVRLRRRPVLETLVVSELGRWNASRASRRRRPWTRPSRSPRVGIGRGGGRRARRASPAPRWCLPGPSRRRRGRSASLLRRLRRDGLLNLVGGTIPTGDHPRPPARRGLRAGLGPGRRPASTGVRGTDDELLATGRRRHADTPGACPARRGGRRRGRRGPEVAARVLDAVMRHVEGRSGADLVRHVADTGRGAGLVHRGARWSPAPRRSCSPAPTGWASSAGALARHDAAVRGRGRARPATRDVSGKRADGDPRGPLHRGRARRAQPDLELDDLLRGPRGRRPSTVSRAPASRTSSGCARRRPSPSS